MKDIKDLTPEEIEAMDYNHLIAIVKETNRIPGGRNTLFEILSRGMINEKSKILEIGTSTGFTAIEISRLVKCQITSIDINDLSLKEARVRSNKLGLSNISFVKADVTSLPFEDNEFDLVIIGNVFSLITNKKTALKECRRVCKKLGLIAAVPMYYLKKPSEELIKEVSDAIQVDITSMYRKDWDEFIFGEKMDVYWEGKYKFNFEKDKKIENFVKNILSRSHLREIKPASLELLKKKYRDYMFLFRYNLSKMGYSIILLSNDCIWDDEELYTSSEINENENFRTSI